MANRIRECISVNTYAPIDFHEAGWESRILREVLLTYEFGDILQHLLEDVTSSTSSAAAAALLVGPPGSGKSHLLRLLQALLGRSGHPLTETHDRIKKLHASLGKKQFLTLSISTRTRLSGPTHNPTLDYLEHYLTHLLSLENPGRLDPDAEVRALGQAVGNLPSDTTVVLFIDELESRLKQRDTRSGARVVNMFRILSKASETLPIAVVAAMNDGTLDSVNYGWLSGEQVGHIMQCCRIEYLTGSPVGTLIGVNLITKNARQRSIIAKVREQLLKILPELHLDEQELINVFPLHPAVVKIGTRLRPYLENFSFPAFAVKAAEKIKNRPAESLFTVDEMLDLLEGELRRCPHLTYAFQAYDKTVEAVLPRVSQGQRLHTRMFIKAILMHTLAGQPATVRDLTNSILFYDLTGKNQSYTLAAAILKQIKSLSKSLEAVGEEMSRQYRFALHQGQMLEERIEAKARTLPDTDLAVGIALVALGGRLFEDWPIEPVSKGHQTWRARYTHIWKVADQNQHGFVIQPAQPEKTISGKLLGMFSFFVEFPVRVGDAKPLFDDLAMSFVNWVPGPLDSDDLWSIKRLIALNELILHQRPSDADESRRRMAELEDEAERIFRRTYLEQGTFKFREGESGRVPAPAGEGPWSLSDWLLPLIRPMAPELPSEDLTPDTLEWIGVLLSPDLSQIDDYRPHTLGEALGGLAGYYQNWQRKDLSRLLEQLRQAPAEAEEIHEVLRAERQLEMTAFHIRHAIAKKAMNEEIEEVMYLFDSDPEMYRHARERMEKVYEFAEVAPRYEARLTYVRASLPTSDLNMEKLKYEMLSAHSSLWQLFDPEARVRLDELFEIYQPLYIEFYSSLHNQASDPAVIEPLCKELVSGEEWSNLELISQLAIARQDFHVDAINQISLIYQMICTEPVRERLAEHPICACGFHPDDAGRLLVAAERTRRYVKRGIEIHREILRGRRAEIRDKLKARKERNADTIRTIAAILDSGDMPRLTEDAIQTLNEVLAE